MKTFSHGKNQNKVLSGINVSYRKLIKTMMEICSFPQTLSNDKQSFGHSFISSFDMNSVKFQRGAMMCEIDPIRWETLTHGIDFSNKFGPLNIVFAQIPGD